MRVDHIVDVDIAGECTGSGERVVAQTDDLNDFESGFANGGLHLAVQDDRIAVVRGDGVVLDRVDPAPAHVASALIRQVRQRTRLLVSFGDCAITANVPGLRNPLAGPAAVLDRSYLELADGSENRCRTSRCRRWPPSPCAPTTTTAATG